MNTEDRFIYRVVYTKSDRVKYISHLDFIRCMNRVFKRAHLPVKYSNGFNPHILLNIALPCPVGVESKCEMLDIELVCEINTAELTDKMNSVMPEGIKVILAERRINQPDFCEITAGKYIIDFKSDKKIDINDFIALDTFMIEKKSKRNINEVNVKDFVRDMKIIGSDGDVYKIEAIINSGSKSNLKPELLISAMDKFFEAKFSFVHTVREKIYFENENFV